MIDSSKALIPVLVTVKLERSSLISWANSCSLTTHLKQLYQYRTIWHNMISSTSQPYLDFLMHDFYFVVYTSHVFLIPLNEKSIWKKLSADLNMRQGFVPDISRVHNVFISHYLVGDWVLPAQVCLSEQNGLSLKYIGLCTASDRTPEMPADHWHCDRE